MGSACFTLHGIGVTRGIAIGTAHVISNKPLEVQHYLLQPEEIEAEIARFDRAIQETRNQIEALEDGLPEEESSELASILYTYLLIVNDSSISRKPQQIIREKRYNAEWALEQQLETLLEKFDDIEDAYLRERRNDLTYVCERILKVLTGQNSDLALNESTTPVQKGEPRILIAHDLNPADVILFKRQCYMAFATDLGGATSHTAIIARSLNIPAIVALHDAEPLLEDDDLVIVDGSAGVLLVNPDPVILEEYQLKQSQLALERQKLKRLINTPTCTIDGTRIELLANIELPEEAKNLIDSGALGVGLFRSEFLFLNRKTLPDEEEQFRAYREVVERMQGLPVTIRTLDVGADKQIVGMHRKSPNPALGLRAIRLCFAEPKMFKTQLRAILRASYYGKLRLLLPMISSSFEMKQALSFIEEVKEELDQECIAYDRQVEIGAMIEIPAAAFAVDAFLADLDFISIGTNDLIQYMLAIDRTDDAVAYLYDPLHPAVLRLLHHVITTATNAKVHVSVCGEMAGDVNLSRVLLGLGLRSFSMHPAQLLTVKQHILKSNISKITEIIQKILKTHDHERIHYWLTRLNMN